MKVHYNLEFFKEDKKVWTEDARNYPKVNEFVNLGGEVRMVTKVIWNFDRMTDEMPERIYMEIHLAS